MSCEVWTNKETYICSMALRTKSELMDKIRECEDTIKDCQAKLRRLAFMTEPKKFYKEEDDVMWQLDRELDFIFEEYDEAQIRLTRLWQFEMAWDDTHDANGKAILPVDPRVLKNQKTYMGGDYCEYVLEDGSEMPEDWWDVYHGWVKPEDCSFADKLGYPLKPQEPERDMTVGELAALMKLQIEERGGFVEVDLNEL